jgi:hypothetical protein
MQGSCADHSPERCRKLVEFGSFDFAEDTVIITQPRRIRPTHFTTMVLYIGDDSRRGTVEYTKEIDNVVLAYNARSPTSRTSGDRPTTTHFVRLKRALPDPEIQRARQVRRILPRPLYEINSRGASFIKASIIHHRDKVNCEQPPAQQLPNMR